MKRREWIKTNDTTKNFSFHVFGSRGDSQRLKTCSGHSTTANATLTFRSHRHRSHHFAHLTVTNNRGKTSRRSNDLLEVNRRFQLESKNKNIYFR